ncbi:hypothetical protein C1896_15105 [Pseudomonadaceae bacterium SI-3]|nr:hypothetical protein C1896_15105 [Pseudomonadaceae bacterium SI-3]
MDYNQRYPTAAQPLQRAAMGIRDYRCAGHAVRLTRNRQRSVDQAAGGYASQSASAAGMDGIGPLRQ